MVALNATSGAKLWSFTTSGSGLALEYSRTVVSGVIDAGSVDTSSYALDGQTRAKLWNYTTGSAGLLLRGHQRYCLGAATTAMSTPSTPQGRSCETT